MGTAVTSSSDVAHTRKPLLTIEMSLVKYRELPADTVVPSRRLPVSCSVPSWENLRSMFSASFTTQKKS
jgi:hypothetical protein